jgi:GntR family transcriptional regulator / MocR family aminotransferase
MQRKHHAIWSSRGSLPVYRKVYQRIRSEILSGRLAAGARLPSSRTLASELGIARGTVVTAFQMLAGEGYTVSAGARGTVVNVALPRARKSIPSAEMAETGGKLRRSISTPPTPLLFQVGSPALDAFPRKQWTRIAARVARQLDGEQTANPNLHDVMGYEPLRRAIASYLRIARDITCSADQILITAGFQGALGLIIQALLKPGAKVWVEDPGYLFARNLLQQSPLRLVGVRIDDGGLDVAAATRSAPDAALALVTPSHQFPLGMTLPIERRLALLDWADRQRAWIVEDDYDCEFHHRGPPPPALKSLDRSGRVLYAGSFSKVLFPGLRLGYLVLPGAVAERFARIASAAFPNPAIMIQKSVEAFMSQGHFARHLSRMRTLYTERRKALAAAIESTMRQYVEIRLQDGGMHFVAWLRGGVSDTEIVEHLGRKGIGPAPLSRCSLRASGHNGLMIGYTNVAKEHAASATRRMLAAIQGVR